MHRETQSPPYTTYSLPFGILDLVVFFSFQENLGNKILGSLNYSIFGVLFSPILNIESTNLMKLSKLFILVSIVFF